MTSVQYFNDRKITATQFIDVLKRSTLSERRPVHDETRIEKMLAHANILITAWSGDTLIGISRAWSDFSFCCYLSDLAVDVAHQKKGIGKELIRRTHEVSGTDATLILLAAPAAINYYPKIGMEQYVHCFRINRTQ